MSTEAKSFTSNEIMGINQAITFLSTLDLKDLGVETTWDVVENTNAIKPVFESIKEMSNRINREYYEHDPQVGTYVVKKGQEEQAEKASLDLEAKTFQLKLKTFDFAKLKDLPGIKAKHLIQLHPIIKR